jgi:hypothetical protein
MASFDSAMRESCTVRESRTNTPLQALNLMNDVTFVEAARVLAQRVFREAEGDDRLVHAFRLVLARTPNEAERKKLISSLAYYMNRFQADPKAASKLITQGDAPPDPAIPVPELAAYTAVASLILNLDETVTKE